MGWEDNIKESTEVGWRFPEGSRRQEKMERYCGIVNCIAPATVKDKGLKDEKTEHKRPLLFAYCIDGFKTHRMMF